MSIRDIIILTVFLFLILARVIMLIVLIIRGEREEADNPPVNTPLDWRTSGGGCKECGRTHQTVGDGVRSGLSGIC